MDEDTEVSQLLRDLMHHDRQGGAHAEHGAHAVASSDEEPVHDPDENVPPLPYWRLWAWEN